jgi:NADPH2:quinone reductase
MTAALGLFQRLTLPDPWTPAQQPTPLVVYGGSSAVGAYAIKLARLANIHPIIAVAGRAAPFVEGLIDRSKGDTIVDYRAGDEAVVEGLRAALGGRKLEYAFDATSEHGSYGNIVRVLEADGRLALVLPGKTYEGIPASVRQVMTMVGEAHGGDKEYAYLMFRYFARGLAQGWFAPHPHEVVPGGLDGVETGMKKLRDGEASAVKYVFQIGQADGGDKAAL